MNWHLLTDSRTTGLWLGTALGILAAISFVASVEAMQPFW